MNTFTRLHKDNAIQGGDGQRQAGKAKKEEKKKRKQRRVDELITAKDFRLDSFFVLIMTTDKANASIKKKKKKNYC
jgi:hypothetical protein